MICEAMKYLYTKYMMEKIHSRGEFYSLFLSRKKCYFVPFIIVFQMREECYHFNCTNWGVSAKFCIDHQSRWIRLPTSIQSEVQWMLSHASRHRFQFFVQFIIISQHFHLCITANRDVFFVALSLFTLMRIAMFNGNDQFGMNNIDGCNKKMMSMQRKRGVFCQITHTHHNRRCAE